MSEKEINDIKKIRNAKEREYYATKKYRTYKSIALSFVDMAKDEHLKELKEKIKKVEKNKTNF